MKVRTSILLSLAMFLSHTAEAKNLQLIESYESKGFAIYRTGVPSAQDMKEFCQLGIQEIMVLSGDADKNEAKYSSQCPSLTVVYNEVQSHDIALTSQFLQNFDKWVQEAQAQGKKVAFRCKCGCHRTGRLAAYYQMKYQNLTPVDALAIMNKHGESMESYKNLIPQVYALYDYIKGKPCSVEQKYCIK